MFSKYSRKLLRFGVCVFETAWLLGGMLVDVAVMLAADVDVDAHAHVDAHAQLVLILTLMLIGLLVDAADGPDFSALSTHHQDQPSGIAICDWWCSRTAWHSPWFAL
jgi:hypothetical protein